MAENEEIKQEAADTKEEVDSNKIEDMIETSMHEKSESLGNGDNDEKQDAEKDSEEDVADVLQDDGDVKLEDLEEQNDSSVNKEVR